MGELTDAWLPDSWEEVQRIIQAWGTEAHDWAGIPLPLPGVTLEVAKGHPLAHLSGVRLDDETTHPEARRDDVQEDVALRNRWYCPAKRCEVWLIQEGSRVRKALVPAMNPLARTLQTFAVVDAWPVEAEERAILKLGELIGDRRLTQYLMTGAFLESSGRSGLTYLFRRLRPTVAMTPRPDDEMRVIAALCLHPVAYYQETWAGAMVPTDDVLSHLILMRGDEARFWRMANQHQADEPAAGIW